MNAATSPTIWQIGYADGEIIRQSSAPQLSDLTDRPPASIQFFDGRRWILISPKTLKIRLLALSIPAIAPRPRKPAKPKQPRRAFLTPTQELYYQMRLRKQRKSGVRP